MYYLQLDVDRLHPASQQYHFMPENLIFVGCYFVLSKRKGTFS